MQQHPLDGQCGWRGDDRSGFEIERRRRAGHPTSVIFEVGKGRREKKITDNSRSYGHITGGHGRFSGSDPTDDVFG